MRETHLSEETLAALAEGQDPAQLGTSVSEHLRVCRSCHAAYADAVRLRAQWLQEPGAFVADESALPEGLAVGRRHGNRATEEAQSAKPTARKVPLLLRPFPAALAGTALMAAVLVLVFYSPLWNRPNTPNEDEITLLRPVIAALSAQGLVLPGGESEPAEQANYRAGTQVGNGVAGAIAELNKTYEAGRASAETSYWLVAGRLAAGQLQNARVVAAEARRAHPDDVRLVIAQAVLAYRESHLDLADELLMEALEIAPHHPVAGFDRGLVLIELGRLDAARSELREVALRQADQYLGRRATEALMSLENE